MTSIKEGDPGTTVEILSQLGDVGSHPHPLGGVLMTLAVLSIWDRWSSGCSLALLGKSDRRDWMDSLTLSPGAQALFRHVGFPGEPQRGSRSKRHR